MDERMNDIMLKAMSSVERLNRWIPFNIYHEDESAEDAAEDSLESKIFEMGYVYVITNIAAYDATTQVSSYIDIGYIDAGLFRSLHREKPDQFMTATWTGQLILTEGCKIKTKFVNTTSGDDLFMSVNGYKIPLE